MSRDETINVLFLPTLAVEYTWRSSRVSHAEYLGHFFFLKNFDVMVRGNPFGHVNKPRWHRYPLVFHRINKQDRIQTFDIIVYNLQI